MYHDPSLISQIDSIFHLYCNTATVRTFLSPPNLTVWTDKIMFKGKIINRSGLRQISLRSGVIA
jgi:hypothetical protein